MGRVDNCEPCDTLRGGGVEELGGGYEPPCHYQVALGCPPHGGDRGAFTRFPIEEIAVADHRSPVTSGWG